MANIDLYQSIQEEKGSVGGKKRIIDRGIWVAIAILAATFVVWGGLKFYGELLNRKIDDLNGQIAEESGRVKSSDIERVADFQGRVSVIKQNLPFKKDPSEFLGNLEKAVISGVVVNSCNFEYGQDGKVNSMIMEASTDNFSLLAQQVLSLKNTDYFNNVGLGKITRGQDGKIKFSIEAEFKN